MPVPRPIIWSMANKFKFYKLIIGRDNSQK